MEQQIKMIRHKHKMRIIIKIYICPLQSQIVHSNNQMSFSTAQDDYNNDIKPDNTCQPLPDAISSIDWIGNNMGNIFACTCWDGTLRVYEVVNNGYSASLTQKMSAKAKNPLTKCIWSQDCQAIYVGDITGLIQAFNVQTQQFVDVGKHTAAISALHIVPGQNIIITAAFENNIHFWQPGNPTPAFTIDMGNKVFCSDFSNPILLVGLGNEKVGIIDITNPNNKTVIDSVDLGKNSLLQSCAINKTSDTIGLSTFDGRSNISTIVKGPNGLYTLKTIITFKSHKFQENPNSIILYPVNAASFSPVSTIWFMTCGSDGLMNFWDFNVRNKIKSLTYGSTPICSARVSQMGDMIAYGLGNDWHIGIEGNKWQPRIGVHKLTEQEMKFAGQPK